MTAAVSFAETSTVLASIIATRIDEAGRDWWRAALEGARDPSKVLAAFAAAGRRLGRGPVVLTDEERLKLRAPGVFNPEGQPLDQVGRLVLLRVAVEASAAAGDLVAELYRTGDLREKQAVLRALAHLADGAVFLDVAVEGVRSNASGILEAIACDNPFPARHLPESLFNQMVMKAVFNELPLGRIVGLGGRQSAELARMAADYADERRAAGRSVPRDLDLIASPDPRSAR
jgi:hypothetical protein